MIEQASLVIGEGNWAVKSDSLLGYKINGGKYYPREMSVVRATTGTRINENGLVEVVPYNLFTYSEQFDNAYWTKDYITITSNAIANPINGELTASAIIPTAVNTYHSLTKGSFPSAEQTNISIYAKAGTKSNMEIEFGSGQASFNLSTGAINYQTNCTATITNVGNGWYLCSAIVPSSSYVAFIVMPSTGTTEGFVGDGSIAMYYFGAQAVQGSSTLDYLPTTDRLDVARIDYSSGSGALLVEPQRTNLALYSSSFDNAAWTKANATITANAAIAPDGTMTADNLSFFGGDTSKYLSQSNTLNGTYSQSVYLKYNNQQWFQLFQFGDGSFYANFDIQNGTLGSYSGCTPSIESVGNGWYRCNITFTTSTAFQFVIWQINNGTSGRSTTSTPTGSVYAWGAQLEAGSYATSYIPTTSASVTRNADVISKTGISSLIGQTEGTLFLDFVPQSKDFQLFYHIRTTGSTNVGGIDIRYQSSSLRAFGDDGGVIQFTISAGDIVVGQRYKCAVRYQLNNVAFYVNGVLKGTDLSASFASSSKDQVSFNNNISSLIPQAQINAAALWKTALTNDELATLTTL